MNTFTPELQKGLGAKFEQKKLHKNPWLLQYPSRKWLKIMANVLLKWCGLKQTVSSRYDKTKQFKISRKFFCWPWQRLQRSSLELAEAGLDDLQRTMTTATCRTQRRGLGEKLEVSDWTTGPSAHRWSY